MLPYLAILTTIMLFSTIEVAVHLLPQGAIDSSFLGAFRFLVAGIVMVSIEWRRFTTLTGKDWRNFALVGVLGLGGTFYPYHYVLQHGASAEEVALIFSLNPIFASIGAVFLLKEKLKRSQLTGLLIGLVGVYVVKFGFAPYLPASLPNMLILLWTALAFGLFTVFNKRLVAQHGPLFTTGLVFLFGGISLLPFVRSFTINHLAQSMPILLYLALGTTLVGYLCYFYGLKRVSVSVGTSLFYLKPLIATALAVCILHSRPSWNFYLGMAIILSALVVTIQPWRKQ